ncbi:carbohydrate kinase family protein [Deinococcus humi]|uniref:Sugar/nucleoside kinase (Ribokinase family) n=1 Tax=Deinococcus humi TaxID=662880 RepID=A0A7W8NFP6_9DEIO|nr:sugar/nucleoside kinase (ribokinase family) [Deinococcus humi]GGO32876.1 carbohydrate kinase [Deinococcus humi]
MTSRDLTILGNVNVDLIIGPLGDWPERGTEALVNEMQWRVGGNAGNAAVASMALGTDCAVVSTIGHDLAGEWLQQQLAAEQVTWLPHAGPTSVTVAVNHSDGERTFLTHLGHLATLEWEDLSPHIPASRFALLAGAFLTPALRRQYPEVLTYFEHRGTQVALDMGWPDGGYTIPLRQEVMGWLPQTRHLLINDLEARALTLETDLQRAAACLAAHLHPEGTVVIKCGADGVLLRHAGQANTHAAPTVKISDTVGAGDIWNAAYLHALSCGREIKAATEFAVQVASLAVSTNPRRYLPTQSF